MIIAIDESGSFAANSNERHFFAAIHLRQRRTLYKLKQRQFADWEATLPLSLKNSKGEIKSTTLSDEQLTIFAQKIMFKPPHIMITPLAVRPTENPEMVLEKHRSVALIGIEEGRKECLALGRDDQARMYHEFGNWLKKLSYAQYLKIFVLAECIATALVNSVGHAISGSYDEELPRMRFLIDKDFVREPRHNAFWHELLRNQLYHSSKANPLPMLDKWEKEGHPFLDKYRKDGRLDFNELFWKRLQFVHSREHFEIRLADAINTILSRFFNQRRCIQTYELVRQFFCADKRVHQLILNDFDLQAYHYDPNENPWRELPHQEILGSDLDT